MKLNEFDLEFILGQIKTLKKEHPKAEVVYNVDEKCVQILYPLPKDYLKLSEKGYGL
jgi:hypothetical protein